MLKELYAFDDGQAPINITLSAAKCVLHNTSTLETVPRSDFKMLEDRCVQDVYLHI